MSAPSPYFAGAKIKPQERGLPRALVLTLLSRRSSLAAVLEAGGAGEGACGTPCAEQRTSTGEPWARRGAGGIHHCGSHWPETPGPQRGWSAGPRARPALGRWAEPGSRFARLESRARAPYLGVGEVRDERGARSGRWELPHPQRLPPRGAASPPPAKAAAGPAGSEGGTSPPAPERGPRELGPGRPRAKPRRDSGRRRAAHTRPGLAGSKMAAEAARSHPAARAPPSRERAGAPRAGGRGRLGLSSPARAPEPRSLQAPPEAGRRMQLGTPPPAPHKPRGGGMGGWGREKGGGKKGERAAAHPGPSVRPAPEMTFQARKKKGGARS